MIGSNKLSLIRPVIVDYRCQDENGLTETKSTTMILFLLLITKGYSITLQLPIKSANLTESRG